MRRYADRYEALDHLASDQQPQFVQQHELIVAALVPNQASHRQEHPLLQDDQNSHDNDQAEVELMMTASVH